MFGVSFATLKVMYKRIKVDHELALALWDTGNLDARNLAVKIVDPLLLTASELDSWAAVYTPRPCGGYVANVAQEGPHAQSRSDAWLASADQTLRTTGWALVSVRAMRDESTSDAWFAARLEAIERTLQAAPNREREAMLHALIAIGCRSPALRASVSAASTRIGPVYIDQGDTACGTPEVLPTLEKTWTHAAAKGFVSPAAQERSREFARLRC